MTPSNQAIHLALVGKMQDQGTAEGCFPHFMFCNIMKTEQALPPGSNSECAAIDNGSSSFGDMSDECKLMDTDSSKSNSHEALPLAKRKFPEGEENRCVQ